MSRRPKHFDRLFKFLTRRGRTREDAEDLIQEAMLRLHVYARAEPVDNEEAFLTYTVRNLSVDQHRRDRPDLRRQVPLDKLDDNHFLIAADVTPDEHLATQQRLDAIRTLLDAVGSRTREIYFAHRAGYSYAEISQQLGISHITIKRHIARALLVIMEHGPLE
jgi:RNA polymerase sigma factor (sigma-70 family)